MVLALRGRRHLLTQNLEEIPSNPQGSRSAAPKTQRLCKSAQPAFIYPRFPFAPQEPALCHAWRLSHVIYIEYAQETVHWSLTKQGRVSIGSAAIWRHSKNYRFSCGVLNLQGVFFFFLVCREHCLLQMLLVYLPCLFYNPTLAGPFFSMEAASSAELICPSACVSFVNDYVHQCSTVQSDQGGV